MFVSDVRPCEEIYKYNSIKLNVLRRETIEADSCVSRVDMAKAVSDMAKDFSLQQYQRFVGKNASQNQNEIAFRTGKNFAL